MATYSERRNASDNISDRVAQNRKRIDRARSELQNAITDLTNLQTEYTGLVAAVNAEADANPNNNAWQTIKDEIQLLASDFVSLKTRAETILAAHDAA